MDSKTQRIDWIRTKHETLFKGIFRNNDGWLEVITPELREEFASILASLHLHYHNNNLKRPRPGIMKVLDSMRYVPFDKVRVVFVADGELNHNGTCFGVSDTNKFSHRQGLILETLGRNTSNKRKSFKIDNPRFEGWREQGVVLLPTAFTTHAQAPKNHSKLWRPVLDAFIKLIDIVIKPVWVIVGYHNKDLKDNLSISNRDLLIPEFKVENLPMLRQIDPFAQINMMLDRHGKQLVRW